MYVSAFCYSICVSRVCLYFVGVFVSSVRDHVLSACIYVLSFVTCTALCCLCMYCVFLVCVLCVCVVSVFCVCLLGLSRLLLSWMCPLYLSPYYVWIVCGYFCVFL